MHNFENEQVLRDAILMARQSTEAKKEFLSRVSHELRTPINIISGYTLIAESNSDNSEKVKSCLSKVKVATRFMLAMLNDILDMSKIESGKRLLNSSEFAFGDFVERITEWAKNLAKEHEVDFETIMDGDFESSYVSDEPKLEQMLSHLIDNAIKYNKKGGKVYCIIRQVRVHKNEAVLRFIVRDNGMGIPKDVLPNIFDPFYAKTDIDHVAGMGLGLPLALNVANLMNGNIDVETEEGKGSVFTAEVSLGLSNGISKSMLEKNVNFEGLTAYVLDSDSIALEGAKKLLTALGATADTFDSESKLLNAIKSGKPPFIVFIEKNLRFASGSYSDVVNVIKNLTDGKTWVVITDVFDRVEEDLALSLGADFCIPKPFYMELLKNVLMKACGDVSINAITEYDFTGKRALVVDDNEMNIELARQLLEHKNMQVETASNGLRALEKFATSEEGYYDIILMDIRMPVMDGLVTARSIRELDRADGKKVPILAMTANAMDEDIELSLKSGMNEHIIKPIEPALFYRKVNLHLQ